MLPKFVHESEIIPTQLTEIVRAQAKMIPLRLSRHFLIFPQKR